MGTITSHDFDEDLRVDEFKFGFLDFDLSDGLRDDAFGGNADSLFVAFGLQFVVCLNALKELFAASRKFDVLSADVNSLLDDSAADLFVDDDSDGSRIDVEDFSGVAVVPFVRHSFVDGSVDDDVDVVSDFVRRKGFGNVNCAVQFEALSEFVSRSASNSVAMGHS